MKDHNFTSYLLQLNPNSQLYSEQKVVLESLIDFLLAQMGIGDSCVDLNVYLEFTRVFSDSEYGTSANVDVAKKPQSVLQITIKSLINILKSSGICGFYTLEHERIEPLPLTLLTVNDKKLLYITRYLHYELAILRKICLLNANQSIYHPLFHCRIQICLSIDNIQRQAINNFPNNEQLSAIKMSALNQLSFITGGPGTGKTTTVLMLLLVLIRVYKFESMDNPRIHIVAPTGKAATRVKESITSTLAKISSQFELNSNELDIIDTISYTTIHRLLGYKYGSIYFKHNEHNMLDIDILIVDESSMISLPLFYKLLFAIDPYKTKHIVFLGDKNQLSSVEEGYVFATLMETAYIVAYDLFTPQLNISQLVSSNRNLGQVSQFAISILNQNMEQINHIIQVNTSVKVKPNNLHDIIAELFAINCPLDNYLKVLDKFTEYTDVTSISQLLFSNFNTFAVLCAVNRGLLGVDNLNMQIEGLIKHKLGFNQEWYTGRPILILENNSLLGLYNGDIGMCVMVENKPVIIFEDGKQFIPELLPHYQLAYVLTIHKSQGSEYDSVYVILPTGNNVSIKDILTCELLYTAVTRAKSEVVIYSELNQINDIIGNKTKRVTGIKDMYMSL